MLRAHMDAIESTLLAISMVSANSGHSLHQGTPRETFIRKFLETHLPADVAIGTGEIIDANSQPGQARNQFDIVIYRRNYPKLDFGGGISGFLIESVVATIEVKSTLTESDMDQAVGAAIKSKSLVPNVVQSFRAGHVPPSILNYVIAYRGPASMRTVCGWLPGIHSSRGVSVPNLPLDERQRQQTSAPSIDGVFVLGKGFAYYDTAPLSFVTQALRTTHPDLKWVFCDTASGNLLLFFTLLTAATTGIAGQWLRSEAYLTNFSLSGIAWGP